MRVELHHRLRSTFHSAVLILSMALLCAACSWILFGPQGALWTLIAVGLAMVFVPSVPPDLILAMHRARPVSATALPQLHQVLDELADRAGLSEPPQLYYVPSLQMNAFAVGDPDDSAIAVTGGMLRGLSVRELAGVLAHEISHIAKKDLRLMFLASIMGRITALLAQVGLILLFLNLPLMLFGARIFPWPLILVLLLAPTAMGLLQLALSRTREFDADFDAARLTSDPGGLASALRTLERQGRGLFERIFARRQPPEQPPLLRTHPSTDERIKRLSELEQPRQSPLSAAQSDAPAMAERSALGRLARRRYWVIPGRGHWG